MTARPVHAVTAALAPTGVALQLAAASRAHDGPSGPGLPGALDRFALGLGRALLHGADGLVLVLAALLAPIDRPVARRA